MPELKKDDIEALCLEIKSNSKSVFRYSTLISFSLLILFIVGSWSIINHLNHRLEVHIEKTERLFIDMTMLEDQVSTLRDLLFDKQEVTPEEVQKLQVTETIAKDVNLRPATGAANEHVQMFLKEQQESNGSDSDELTLLIEAKALRENGELNKALEKVNAAIRLNSESSTALSFKASILKDKGDLDEAIRLQTMAIEIEKQKSFSSLLPNFYNTRGFMFIEGNDLDKAKSDFETGSNLALDDEKVFIRENLILIDLYKAEWESALKQSDAILELNAESGWTHFFRAISADKLQEKSKRDDSLTKWHEISTESGRTRLRSLIKETPLAEYEKWLEQDNEITS